MASTVVRSASKTGLVLLESSVDMAEDGFVSIQSRWLAPSAGLASTDFAIDSAWPISTLPTGLPPIQGGPYLVTRTIQKQNGLTIVQATYATALNPPRVVVNYSDSTGTFSGYAPPVANTTGNSTFSEGGALLSFDYIARTATTSYAVVEPNTFAPQIKNGFIATTYNTVTFGNYGRVSQTIQNIQTRTEDIVGRVRRISVQSTPTYVQSARDRLIAAARAVGAS